MKLHTICLNIYQADNDWWIIFFYLLGLLLQDPSNVVSEWRMVNSPLWRTLAWLMAPTLQANQQCSQTWKKLTFKNLIRMRNFISGLVIETPTIGVQLNIKSSEDRCSSNKFKKAFEQFLSVSAWLSSEKKSQFLKKNLCSNLPHWLFTAWIIFFALSMSSPPHSPASLTIIHVVSHN